MTSSEVLQPASGVIIEIRAGTGGEEAALFASRLLRMYQRFAARHNWPVQVLDTHLTDLGGIRQTVLEIKNSGALKLLKNESGIHRVQRIPATEKSGRIHTSTATVTVLPEFKDAKLKLDEKDLKIEAFRAGGPGGQNVNKVSSAIRITHLPTGIVASSQNQRSQYQNRETALKILRAKLYSQFQAQEIEKRDSFRKKAVGTADRSEKIRTYNFPQNRLTDHRINKSWHKLEKILDGDLMPVLEALQ
jgi:peptide chain release factor 1